MEMNTNTRRKRQAPTMRREPPSTTDAPFDPPSPVNESPFIDTSENMRGKRGSSRNLKLQRLPPGVKPPLEWDMYDCPIGEHANALSTQCGIVIKHPENCPLQKRSFMHIEKEKRLQLIDLVMEHFDSERTKRRDRYVMSKLCKKYNDYRCFLRKSYFLKHKTYAERLENRPLGMLPEDWRWLVKFWTTDKKFQNRSIQSRANSSCLTLRHNSGSRSYARCREEWRKKNEKEPSRLELFEITHKKNDEAAASVFDAFARAKSELENTDGTEFDDETIYDLQFPQKRPGRLHGMGPVVKPSQVGLTNGSSSLWRQQEHNDTIRELKGKASELENKVTEMKTQFSSMMARMMEICSAQGISVPTIPHMVGASNSASSFSE